MPTLFIARLARASRPLLLLVLLIGSLSYLASPSPSPVSGSDREGLQELSPVSAMQSAGGVPAIEGWVSEQSTGKPLAGATVRIAGASRTSGDDGYFSF